MASLLLVCSLGGSCAPGQDFDNQLGEITRPFKFSIVKWELSAIFEEAKKIIGSNYIKSDDEAAKVAEYFSATERIKSLESEIEAVNSGDKPGKMASLEAELNRLQQQNLALADIVEKIRG